jgi:hypothetical protein
MVNRRKFLSDSLKVLLGAGVGAVATGYVDRLAPYSARSYLQGLIGDWLIARQINPNGDFSEGVKYWEPHISPGLKTSKWGYNIVPNEFGQVWIDNPVVSSQINSNDHVAMYQDFNSVKWAGIEKSDLMLRRRRFTLEADVRMESDAPDDLNGFCRGAVAFSVRKPDDSSYTFGENEYDAVYMELDFYRRNQPYIGGPPADNYSYPVDQIPLGEWKHFSVDVTDSRLNGFKNQGARERIFSLNLCFGLGTLS